MAQKFDLSSVPGMAEAQAAFEADTAMTSSVDAYRTEKAAEAAASSIPAGPAPKLKSLSRADIMDAPFPEWLVYGVLPKTGLAALAGEPGAGKSFLALELAGCLACGYDFFGLKTEQREVLYVCLEGQSGLKARLTAWERKHGRDYPDDKLHVVTGQINLLNAEDRQELFEMTPSGGVLIVDTMAQATAGQMDENNSKDMGGLIAACNAIAQGRGCLVVLVAHVGKDEAKGIRGHSSLFGALDAQITVRRPRGENRVREWNIGKAKDSDDGRRFGFELWPVEVGTLPDGSIVSSCYVERAELPAASRPSSGLGGEVSRESAEKVEAALKVAMQKKSGPVTKAELASALAELFPDSSQAARLKLIGRAIKALQKEGRVSSSDGLFSLS